MKKPIIKLLYVLITMLFSIGNIIAQDEPCSATPIGAGITSGTTSGFTQTSATLAPNPTICAGYTNNGTCWDPWFVYTAVTAGDVVFNLINVSGGTGSTANLVYYTGPNCSSLTEQGCVYNDITPTSVTLQLVAGQKIWLRVYDYNCNPAGKNFSIQVSAATVKLDATTSGSTINLPTCIGSATPVLRLTDSGDGTGNYTNNENFNITFNAPANSQVWIKEIGNTLICPGKVGGLAPCTNSDGNDYLKMYDGTNLVRNITGNTLGLKFGNYKTTNGSVRFTWNSTAVGINGGWQFDIYCVPNPTVTPTVTVPCGGTVPFTDPGGTGGNYPNNAHNVWTYCPGSNCGDVICVDMGTTDLEDRFDVLYVFDGNSTNAPLHSFYQEALNSVMGTLRASPSNPTGCLTFMLVSDGGVAGAGWNSVVGTCQPIGPNGADNCASATDVSGGGLFQSNTFAAVGEPFGPDPDVNIGSGTCDPTNTSVSDITQLESTIWYKFTTPAINCAGAVWNFSVENVSCFQTGTEAGAQFVLYDRNTCTANGANWDASRIYCADIIQSGAGINIPGGLITPNNTYYIMMDAFAARYCDLDLRVSIIGDFDNDGICDVADLDDDNDGIPDTEEVCGIGVTTFSCLPNGSDPAADDDNDGIPNYRDPTYCNGCIADTDGDGTPDYLDKDSDDDGCFDTVEAGFPDPDDDGIVGNAPFIDTNDNGWSNEADPANGGTPSTDITDAYDQTVNICLDCIALLDDGIDICTIIVDGGGNLDPNHPLSSQDCDNGGVDNYTECVNGEDPSNPADDCIAAIDANLDICALINNDPFHPLSDDDCDNGGVPNYEECQTGEDPSDPGDDCIAAIDGNLDICMLIAGSASHPLANQDCDNGGVPNITECQTGEDPSDPADDCTAAIDGNLDICVLIGGNASHPLANQDCDNGGISNISECQTGEDPSNPTDDCLSAIDGGQNICTIIGNNPNHPMASQDCDNGGVDNFTECQSGEDPSDPADDCIAAIDEGINICTLINNDPNHPMANLDCDNGGVINITECQSGEDPSDPADDCQTAIDEGINICTLIGNDPNHPMATLDCDNGGIQNYTECLSGEDPSDPVDDCQSAIDNGQNICTIIGGDPNHPMASPDCDNGGIDNYTECQSGEDPSNPIDDCQAAIDEGINICILIGNNQNHPMANIDCDNGGIDNYTECQSGEDPSDPADDCQTAIDEGINICTIINNNQNHPMANQDCDNGGIDNYTECLSGEDPNNPADDCQTAIDENLNICVIIGNLPNHPMATLDCDNGGIDNFTECQNGADPSDPADDCQAAIDEGADICVIIFNNPNHPLATPDCDMGGIDNYTECQNGADSNDPADDCQAAIDAGINICTLIGINPNHPLSDQDCDNGGIDNYTECLSGEDPTDPADDCKTVIDEQIDVCSIGLATKDLIITGVGDGPLTGGQPKFLELYVVNNIADLSVYGIESVNNGGGSSAPEFTFPALTPATAGSFIYITSNGPNFNTFFGFNADYVSVGSMSQNGDDAIVLYENGVIIDVVGDPNMSGTGTPWEYTDGWLYRSNNTLASPTFDVSNWDASGTDVFDGATTNANASSPFPSGRFLGGNNPLGESDCDGDGVTNADECADGTNPLDPCDYDGGSITGPVTADQTNCPCPDLSPIVTMLPNNIAGASSIGLAVEVFELDQVPTNGTDITVRIPSDPRFTFNYDPTLTFVAFVTVDNARWTYLGDNGIVHSFRYSQVLGGGMITAFGINGNYDPQNTDGRTTITATIIPFNGGECEITNNTDAETLIYFQ